MTSNCLIFSVECCSSC